MAPKPKVTKSQRAIRPRTTDEDAPTRTAVVRRSRTARLAHVNPAPTSIVSAYNDPDEEDDTVEVFENENMIVQLNIHDGESTDADITDAAQSSNHHTPYTPNNAFQSIPMDVSIAQTEHTGTTGNTECPAPHPKPPRVVELLKEFEMKSKAAEWPSSTSICCYWCCHQFRNAPFGVPVKYTDTDEKFSVFGCFCSLECAAAYNFDSSAETIDEKWERYNLITFLARKLGLDNTGKVKLAPNRLALTMFGGHMDIDEFRSAAESSKLVNVNFPPMTTLTQQVEEINDTDARSEYRYIPLDIERINRYKEKMVLKRSKPTTAFKKNTLDSLMNLRFSSNQ
jgi:hypothetical protein